MWDFTEKDRTQIESIYEHFIPLITNVTKEQLYDRIYGGYCYGEGGFRILTIEDWEKVFNYKNNTNAETVFTSWDDYFQYEGDYHKKIKRPQLKLRP